MKLWQQGRTITRSYRNLWFGLYVGKMILALVISLPVLALTQADLDYSGFARPLLQEWSIDIVGELILVKANVFSFGMLILATLAVLAFLLKQFLNGGIYDCLVNGSPLQGERFFAQSVRMFRSHLLVGIGMAFVFLLLFLTAALFGEMVSAIARRLIPSQDMTRFVIRVAVTYAVVLVGAVYSDYIRTHLTLSQRVIQPRGIGASFKAGYLFFIHHGVQSMSVYAAYFAPFVLVWLLVEGLALLVTAGMGNMYGAVIEFLLFQFCSLARVLQSLSGTLALADLMKEHYVPEMETVTHEATLDGPTLLP